MDPLPPPDPLHPASFPSLLGRPPSPLGRLGSYSGNSPPPSSSGLNWKEMIHKHMSNGASSFDLSFIPEEFPEVHFSAEDLDEGKNDWELALVGHALGKQPFYGSLLEAVRKKWKLVGTLDLLTLEGDFFLFKFSCKEDYDMVWNGGPCFLNGKPFIFQKWSWDFRPIKEDYVEIPLWIKLPNFPLCCWNERGLSRVASKVGIPLAADHLTTSKSRLTFARVCVQISPSSVLPDSIPIMLNGKRVDQRVEYDWKPRPCTKCNTFAHECYACPLAAPVQALNTRGRSRGRGRNMKRDRSFTRPPVHPLHGSGEQQDPNNPQRSLMATPAPPPPPSSQGEIPVLNPSLALSTNPLLITNPFSSLTEGLTITHTPVDGQPSGNRERRLSSPPLLTDLNSPPPAPSSPNNPDFDPPGTEVGGEVGLSSSATEESRPSSPVDKTPKPNPKSTNQQKGRRKK